MLHTWTPHYTKEHLFRWLGEGVECEEEKESGKIKKSKDVKCNKQTFPTMKLKCRTFMK